MKNKPRLLTVKQFTEEKNITKTTVLRWVKEGRIEGATYDEKGFYLIPESNLSLAPIQRRGRPRKYEHVTISTEEEARERYDSLEETNYRKVPFSYDELKKMLTDDLTYNEIAQKAGVTRQAIEQIHRKYFASFIPSARERQKNRTNKNREEKRNSHLDTIPKLSILKKMAKKVDMEVKPIPLMGVPLRSRTGMVLVNGKRCGVHYTRRKSKTSDRSYRYYYRVWLYKDLLSDTEFTICITGKKNHRIFIVPSKVLLDLLPDTPANIQKMVHIPYEYLPVYKNQPSELDWVTYENAWSLLDE
jgi:predicted DNA-binding protein YlxM (UPF0122 family)